MKYITSMENTIIKNTQKLKQKKGRDELLMFLCEGAKLCDEALDYADVAYLLVCENYKDKYLNLIQKAEKSKAEIYIISEKVMNKLSEQKTPQGVFCVVKKSNKTKEISSDKKYIALSQLQDPGNVGAIIRSADAFLIDGIIVDKYCADVYSQKVVQSTMGAVFRVDIILVDEMDDFIKEKSKSIRFICACLDKNSKKVDKIFDKSGCVVIIGNEGNGLKQSTIELCNESLYIEMKGKTESLNASNAASIIMWEMTKE